MAPFKSPLAQGHPKSARKIAGGQWMSAYYDHEHFWAPHEVCLRPQPDPIQPTQRQGLGQLFDAIAESIRTLFGERTSKS